MTSNEPPVSATSVEQRRYALAGGVTVVALIGLGMVMVYLASLASSTELIWTRTVYALTPVETIAFAAVGWLFGREVHRQEATTAKARAEHAEARGDKAQAEVVAARTNATEERSRGTELARNLINKLHARSTTAGIASTSGTERVSRPPTAELTDPDLVELAGLAASLYPELARGQTP